MTKKIWKGVILTLITIIVLATIFLVTYFSVRQTGLQECTESWREMINQESSKISCEDKSDCINFMKDNGILESQIPDTRCRAEVCEVYIPQCVIGK